MKCSICGEDAVSYRRYEGRYLCRSHFFRATEREIARTIAMNGLIAKKDHIAVGLSGGKDSTILLYALSKIAEKRRDMKLSAILVDEGIKGYREKSIPKARAICKKLKVKLHITSFKKEFGKTLDQIVKKNNLLKNSLSARNSGTAALKACTFCGVFRRHMINKTAREIGATKVAIGHNLDDEAQAIMANYIRGDLLRGARLGARAYVAEAKGFVPRIKPLRNIPEKETALYVLLKCLDVDFGECPYASESFRWTVRDMLNDLEVKYPGTKFNIVRTYGRIQPAIQNTLGTGKIGKCEKCGEPASRKMCKVCELRARI